MIPSQKIVLLKGRMTGLLTGSVGREKMFILHTVVGITVVIFGTCF
jgi:hypothetical protein